VRKTLTKFNETMKAPTQTRWSFVGLLLILITMIGLQRESAEDDSREEATVGYFLAVLDYQQEHFEYTSCIADVNNRNSSREDFLDIYAFIRDVLGAPEVADGLTARLNDRRPQRNVVECGKAPKVPNIPTDLDTGP